MSVNVNSNRFVNRAIFIIERDCPEEMIMASFEVPKATLAKVNRVFRLCTICSEIMHRMLINKMKLLYKYESVVYCETPDRRDFERLIFR